MAQKTTISDLYLNFVMDSFTILFTPFLSKVEKQAAAAAPEWNTAHSKIDQLITDQYIYITPCPNSRFTHFVEALGMLRR